MRSSHETFDSAISDFRRSLRARNRSPKTVRSYVESATLLATWQRDHGRPDDPAEVTQADIESFITDQLDRWTPSTAATRFRCLQQLFRFCVDEGVVELSPMERMKPPSLDEKPVPILSADDIKKLVKVCSGKSFEDRRDLAILRLFIATGIRLGEMAGIQVEHLDLDAECATVFGKGNRGRVVAYGPEVALTLSRYVRERRRHAHAGSEWLWVGPKGKLTDSGIAQMIERRSRAAGVEGVHAHRFRHSFAHEWLAAGGAETDLRELAGWRSADMVARYTASAAAERARDMHRKLGIGEGL